MKFIERLLGNPRQTPFIFCRQHTDRNRHHHAHNRWYGGVIYYLMQTVIYQAAEDRCHRIDVFSQHAGHFLTHHIAEHAAANSGKGAEEDAQENIVAVACIDAGLGTGHHEGPETDGIEHVIDII